MYRDNFKDVMHSYPLPLYKQSLVFRDALGHLQFSVQSQTIGQIELAAIS